MTTLAPTGMGIAMDARLYKSPSMKHFNVARELREGLPENKPRNIDSAPVLADISRRTSFAASSVPSQQTGVPTRQSYMDMAAPKQSYIYPSAMLQPPQGLNLPRKYYVTDIQKRSSTWHWVPSMRAYIPDREVPPGTKVRLVNLASPEGEVWNDVECYVKSFDSESWRYILTVPPSVLYPLGAEIVCAADNIQLGEDMEPLSEYADMIRESVQHQQRLSSKTYIPKDSKAHARKSGRDFTADSFPNRATEWVTTPPEKPAVEPSVTPPKAAPVPLTAAALPRSSSVPKIPMAQMQAVRATQPMLTQPRRLSCPQIGTVTLSSPPMLNTDQFRQRIAQQPQPGEPVITPLHPALGAPGPRLQAATVPAQTFKPYQLGQLQRLTTGAALPMETFKPYQVGQFDRLTTGATDDRYTDQGLRILAEYPMHANYEGTGQHYYATGYAPWMTDGKEKGETTAEAVVHAAQTRQEQDLWKTARTKIQAARAFASSGADFKSRKSGVASGRMDSKLDIQRAQSSAGMIPRMTHPTPTSRTSLPSYVSDDRRIERMKMPRSSGPTEQRGSLHEFTVVPSRSKTEIVAAASS